MDYTDLEKINFMRQCKIITNKKLGKNNCKSFFSEINIGTSNRIRRALKSKISRLTEEELEFGFMYPFEHRLCKVNTYFDCVEYVKPKIIKN